jgi:hypothetical protein
MEIAALAAAIMGAKTALARQELAVEMAKQRVDANTAAAAVAAQVGEEAARLAAQAQGRGLIVDIVV